VTYLLAASAEMLFTELPFVERVRAIHERGLGVEIWDWTTKDLDELAATGANFTSMTGYIEGDLLESDGIARFLETAEQSIVAARVIDADRLNVHGTGLDRDGHAIRKRETVTAAERATARDTLARLADLGAKHDAVFMLENLNLLVDHPGTPFGRAEDTIDLVSSIDHPHLQLNLDLYHAQIGEGNLVELVRQALPWIGEIQVADVPGRQEPGTGEINYSRIARELVALKFESVVGLEGWASGDSSAALDAFVEAFSVGA
jgi:hydroxypyruvate isomerase